MYRERRISLDEALEILRRASQSEDLGAGITESQLTTAAASLGLSAESVDRALDKSAEATKEGAPITPFVPTWKANDHFVFDALVAKSEGGLRALARLLREQFPEHSIEIRGADSFLVRMTTRTSRDQLQLDLRPLNDGLALRLEARPWTPPMGQSSLYFFGLFGLPLSVVIFMLAIAIATMEKSWLIFGVTLTFLAIANWLAARFFAQHRKKTIAKREARFSELFRELLRTASGDNLETARRPEVEDLRALPAGPAPGIRVSSFESPAGEEESAPEDRSAKARAR